MKIILCVAGLFISLWCYSQDPHFSQFYASPLTVSPTQTMNTSADLRVMANLRQQWLNPASPYYTGSFSVEKRIMQNQTGSNGLGIGFGFMHDNTFNGILKSSYATFSIGYHQLLDEDLRHQCSVGFSTTYGNKKLDVTRLVFASQFTSGGFDTNLPSGETALSSMKPFLSVSTGLSYEYNDEQMHFDLGAAGFHLNNPRQTFLQDAKQTIPKRYVIHSSLDLMTAQSNVVNLCAMYQKQAVLDYVLVGASYGFCLSGSDVAPSYLNAGLLYRVGDSFIPVISFTIKDFQAGLSYDATTSKLARTTSRPNTFELSFSWRMNNDDGGRLKCPYSPWR